MQPQKITTNNNNFYVYIYLDPRKPGKYTYGDCCFLYEPFYIGKGKGNRYKDYNYRNNYFQNKINKIKRCGYELIIIKIEDRLNENESFILESKLIKLIGRFDLNKGPLINLTDGGEGISGYKFSDCIKKYKSEKWSDKNNPMYNIHRYGIDNPFYGKKHSRNVIQKISSSKIGFKHSEKTKIKISNKLKNRKFSEKTIIKMSIAKSGKNNTMYGKHLSIETKNKISLYNKGKKSGEKHPNVKLKLKHIHQIKKLNKLGFLNKEISIMFNISTTQISRILSGKRWSHVK